MGGTLSVDFTEVQISSTATMLTVHTKHMIWKKNKTWVSMAKTFRLKIQ